MEKYIIIALILLFGVVYYFDKQSNDKLAALEQSSTLEIDKKHPQSKSFWKIFVDHNKSKNYYKDRGITVKSSNKPDSDTSACVGVTKSDKDMIITKFAGYVLEYPCSTTHMGEYHIKYDSENKIIEQRYRLKLLATDLTSDGNKVSFDHIVKRIKNAKKIKESIEKDFIVYEEKNHIIAILKINPDINGLFPHIICDRYGNVDPYKLFSPFHDIKKKSQCGIYWRLTKDIKASMLFLPSKFAYNFKDIFEKYNKTLKSFIVEYPNNPQKPTEK